MKIKRAVLSFGVITVVYVLILLLLDFKKDVFSELITLQTTLPILVVFTFVSFILRFIRWYWLLSRVGYPTSVVKGFLAYVAGFAFTATPGKLGELVRIRYLKPLGVPYEYVISAFLFERIFDLLVVLMFILLAATRFDQLPFVVLFVLFIISMVFFLFRYPRLLSYALVVLRLSNLRKLAKYIRLLKLGITGLKLWCNFLDICVSFSIGIMAWGLIAMSFVLLLAQFGLDIPVIQAIGIYPVALLAGAASMVPGGIGSTEAVIIYLLSALNVSLAIATLVAIAIRLSTLWFAIICGLLALILLEYKQSILSIKHT